MTAACTQTPPETFLTPEFEEVTIDDSDPASVRFVCTMSSMAQLTEYGLIFTDKPDSDESGWTRKAGTPAGNKRFEVILHNLTPGTTYQYRFFIGNGRDVIQSAINYYTTPI